MRAESARLRSRSPPNTTRCKTAIRHLKCWGEGDHSAVEFSKFMRDALDDGFRHPSIDRLAKIDHGGERHCLNNLLNLLRSHTDITTLISVCQSSTGTVDCVIAPTAIFNILLARSPVKFAQVMGAQEERLVAFWTGLFASPQGLEFQRLHPHLRNKSPEDLKHTVPLRLHEGAGPFSKGGSVNVISWSPLRGRGIELESKYVYCTHIKEAGEGPDESAWQGFIDNLDALAHGMLPDGTPLAGADGVVWSGLMLFGGADLEVECLSWGLASYNEVDTDCCGWCLGDRRHRPLNDLRRKAKWRPTQHMSNLMFMERLKEKNHPLSRAPFVNKFFFRLDVMHVYDHHGIACIVVGSTLKDIVTSRNSFGASQPARLEAVNARLSTFNSAPGGSVTIPKLRLDNLTLDHWAELHGPLYKSAICRRAS